MWADTRAKYQHLVRGSGFRSMLVRTAALRRPRDRRDQRPAARRARVLGARGGAPGGAGEPGGDRAGARPSLRRAGGDGRRPHPGARRPRGGSSRWCRRRCPSESSCSTVTSTWSGSTVPVPAPWRVPPTLTVRSPSSCLTTRARRCSEFLGAASSSSRRGGSVEEEMIIAGDARIFRFTVAPVVASERSRRLRGRPGGGHHARRRASSARCCSPSGSRRPAGCAAGVAHELNNPLATIAGCAESLQGQLGAVDQRALAENADFRQLPRPDRGGGLPLQGDHREPAPVRA